jgi:hypothetical protein
MSSTSRSSRTASRGLRRQSRQLREGEWLNKVVVGARLEARDAVGDLIARGEHQHRRATAIRPVSAAHGQPVNARQADVEHDDIRLLRGDR